MNIKMTRKLMFAFFIIFMCSLPLSTLIADSENNGQNGLKGEFYTSSEPGAFDFDEKKATVVTPNINFGNLESLLEELTGQADDASVRWTGQLMPEFTEDYTFSMIGDNGFRLWIDNELVIDHWVNDWDNEQESAPISLEAGQKYDIKIEYFEDMGGSNLKLSWSSDSQPKEVVPIQNLYLPEDYSVPGPTNGVISADGMQVSLNFENALEELPDEAASYFSAIGNKQVVNAERKADDPSTIILELDYPITSKDNDYLYVSYDGNGPITTTEGNSLEGFTTFAINNSEYIIASPWAEEVDAENVLPEYPRPQMVRDDWMNLNGEWQFESAASDDSLPTGQTLDETILVPFAVESKLSGIERHEDHMWYKRNFTIPEEWSNNDLLLHFGAVDWETNVYVNGNEVGTHKGGYDAFNFNISEYLVEGENELIVEVKDSTSLSRALGKQRLNPGGIFYTSVSGIWQTVWLEPVSNTHISNLKMTPEIDDEYLELQVDATNHTDQEVEAIAYKEGEEVGRVTGTVGEKIQIPVPNPRLWSTTDPFLYDLEVRLKDEDTTVDEVTSYFGMREISKGMVDGTLRPLLNGEFVFQMGPLDQGYWPAGLYTAPTDEALKFDIEQAKSLGFNMIRKHAKVEPQRFHYWADKMGMLVWQDMPSMFNNNPSPEEAAQFEHEFEEMINEHYNSPSLILWTVFNEGWGQYDTERITNWVEDLDPTRLVSNASGWTDVGAGDVIDFHAYVGPDSPTPTEDRIAVLGEYGGLGLHVPGNEWSGNVFNYEMQSSKEALTNRYLGLIDGIKVLKENPGLSAAVYTQITDVEIEINGLLSYDRKIEKANFDKLRAAHRELIGIVENSDLEKLISEAQELLDNAQIGEKPGQYDQAVADALQKAIASAQEFLEQNVQSNQLLKEAIADLEEAMDQFKDQVNPPITIGATVDQFDSDSLSEEWSIYREVEDRWSLTDVPGKLRILTSEGDSHEASNSLKNLFLRDAPDGDFEITTKVTAPIRQNHQQAGLYIWEDEDNYVRLGHVWDTSTTDGYSIETAKEEEGTYSKPDNMVAHPETDTIYLKLKKMGDQVTSYYWNGSEWIQAADPMTVSLDNIKVGFYGTSTFAGDINADFDYFTLQALPINPPDLQELMDSYIESGDLTGPLAEQLTNTYKQAVHHYEKESEAQARKFIEKYLTQIEKPSMQKHISEEAKEALVEAADAFSEQLDKMK
ncbi:FIMAH domain-containing protein [Gracilibacillus sp. D59]|uniref:FIMAH domain-containing protein n=1 Tax=Gracilibacillus sp. D59 TaxID=3457434 RepID=UPI003FCC9FA3